MFDVCIACTGYVWSIAWAGRRLNMLFDGLFRTQHFFCCYKIHYHVCWRVLAHKFVATWSCFWIIIFEVSLLLVLTRANEDYFVGFLTTFLWILTLKMLLWSNVIGLANLEREDPWNYSFFHMPLLISCWSYRCLYMLFLDKCLHQWTYMVKMQNNCNIKDIWMCIYRSIILACVERVERYMLCYIWF